MTTVAVVQARTGSTRLPGKVLADVSGEPMLAVMLHRLETLPVDGLVVATSTAAGDDAVAAVATSLSVPVVRGPEEDVLARFGRVLDEFPAEHVVRLTADCPLMDPAVVTQALQQHARGADYTSNTLVRTFPDGLDVEVVRVEALRVAMLEARDPAEREHVTPFIYRRPRRWKLLGFRTPLDVGDERWTVDTADDLEFVRRAVGVAGRGASWLGILEAVGRRPTRQPDGSLRLRSADERDADRLLEWRNDPDAVRFSVSGTPVSPAEHRTWMRSWLDRPATRVWVGEVAGKSVGQARIDVDDGVGLVSIAVAPAERGQGRATELLTTLVAQLSNDLQVQLLRAQIHRDNLASLRAFAKAGFVDGTGTGEFREVVRPL